MNEVDYELDPEGDTILTLCNPNAPFAVPIDPASAASTESLLGSPDSEETTTKRWSFSFISFDPAHPAEEPYSEVLAAEPAYDVPAQEEPAGTPEAAGELAPRPPPAPTPTGSQASAPLRNAQEIRLRLSSRHLALASRYFKAAFERWIDGPPYLLNAEDWDTEALLILMNIIHGRTWSVPRSVDLEKLAKIAVLVDHYMCYEAVDLFSDIWIKSLSCPPSECGRDLVLWLLVVSVFPKDSEFKTLTKIIIRESHGRLDTLGLPICEELASRCLRRYESSPMVADHFYRCDRSETRGGD